MLIVQKYGGTSLADPQRIHAAALRAVQLVRQGHRIVMVVSARGHTTDELLQTARTVSPANNHRELDALLSAGEQISAALTAMAVEALGQSAVSLTGWQAGIRTDDTYGNARILGIDCSRIRRELQLGKIVIVAGFQGIGPGNDITTLGRGGSDTTAVALAAFLKADKCQIFTDVDGVYDRDPQIFPDACRYETIGYGQMMELIGQGAQVLHDRSVEFAEHYGITLEVLSAFSGKPGTLVGRFESL